MNKPHSNKAVPRSLESRHRLDRAFVVFCMLVAGTSIVILAVLLSSILTQGLSSLSWSFLTNPASSDPAKAGIRPALFGSIWVCGACAMFALPIGVATAIFLEEFKPRGAVMRALHGFIQLNISNLAGVPSVVYGIIGLTVFGGMFGIFGAGGKNGFEIGARYYDQFLSEGDRILRVPVDGRDVPLTQAVDGLVASTKDGQLVRVNVIGPRDSLPEKKGLRAVTLRSDAQSSRIPEKSFYYFRFPFGRGVLT